MCEIEFVRNFHLKYHIPILSKNEIASKNRIELRITLLNEEIKELLEAHQEGILANIAKESCDVMYVIYGTALELGYIEFDNYRLFDEVISPLLSPDESLNLLQKAQYDFQEECTSSHLKEVLKFLGCYIDSVNLKSVYPQVIQEVNRSNMSKGTNGQPVIRTDGKIMKGEDYSPADLRFLNV